MVTRYIGTANRLNDLTEDDILGKLKRPSKARPATADTDDQALTNTKPSIGAMLAISHYTQSGQESQSKRRDVSDDAI